MLLHSFMWCLFFSLSPSTPSPGPSPLARVIILPTWLLVMK